MPLHIEQVADYIKDFAQTNFAAALGNLYLEHDAEIQLVPPQPDSYFLGEPDRYRPFACPALFVNPVRTRRPRDVGKGGFNTVLYQEHPFELVLLVEAIGEDILTRMCLRYAQALDALINEFTLEPGVITDYSALAHVTDIDYGVTYTKTMQDQRTFRRDVTLALLVQHWDQYTQLPLQTGSGAQITSVVGQACTGGVLTSVSDTLLTTTSPTQITVATAASNGNYGVYGYLRIASACNLTITVSWMDGSGPQSSDVVNGTQTGGGSYMLSTFFINAIAGTAITVTATTDTPNVVTVSSTIESLT